MAVNENLFDQWESEIDQAGLADDVAKLDSGEQVDRSVPNGNYAVNLIKLELTATKKDGKPMASFTFQIIDGQYKKSRIWVNYVLTTSQGVHNCNDMMRDMDTGLEIKFKTMRQYNKLLLDVFEAVNGKLNFDIEVKDNERNPNFKDYKILKVYDI